MKILNSIREYKTPTILASSFMCLEVIVQIIIPLQMAKIIDIGIKNSDLVYVSKMGFTLLLMSALSLILGVFSSIFAAKASSGFAKNLRKDIFYKIQDFSFENMDKFPISSLITRMGTDITNIQMAFMLSIRLLVRTILMIILSLFMTYKINSTVGLIFLLISFLLTFLLAIVILKAFPLFGEAYKKYDDFNKSIRENISGIRVVKSFVREEHEISKFEIISHKIYELFKKAGTYVAFNSFFMQFSIYAIIIVILLIGGKNIVYGNLGQGEVTSLVAYAMQILFSIMALSFVFVMILISKASNKRITEVLNEEPKIKDKKNALDKIENYDIKFNNVDFAYNFDDDKLVLNDINLEIKSGQFVGIIGSTGSAKSTLVNLIPRLYEVSSGYISLGGIDIKEYKLKTLRDNIAVVLQKNVLFSGTIKDNIKWGNENASDEEVIAAAKLAQAHNFIESFPDKYETLISQGGTNVSGGQKQRLCIARALLKKPKILILDDSTSALDTKTDYLIRKAFKEEIPNTTKIVISQRVSSIYDADLIVVLEDGKINGIGTHEELVENNEIYKDIYISQMKGDNDEK